MGTDKINVILNGIPVSGTEGMTILELARENGVDIPTLCYMSELSPTGACRICVVEVTGSRTLVAACHTPIRPNMEIFTHSPKVLKTRKVIMELLFASHSGSCVMCDKANICELRLIATDLEVGLSRFEGEKHYYSIDELSDYVVRDMTKCILCRKCVRACREIKGECAYAVINRGSGSEIIIGFGQKPDKETCEACNLCIQECPVGALERKEEKFAIKVGSKPLIITG